MSRTVGVVLLVGAVGICLLGGALLAAGLASGSLQAGGAILGLGLLLVLLVGPLAAGGVYIITRSQKQQAEEEMAEKQRKILDMVKTRGKVNISDVIIELQSDLTTVQSMIYKLVGMGVFSGYVNWDEGVLYSTEASSLRGLEQCKNCGGKMSFAGKGIIKCPFCRTEYFLP